MSRMKSKTLACILLGGAIVLASSCESGSFGDASIDGDIDVDTDTDVETDADVGTDADVDSDADSDGDDDLDGDLDTAPDSDTDVVGRRCGDGSCNDGETSVDCPVGCCRPSLSVGPRRGSDSPTLVRPAYDYAPSVMHYGVYRMWWCGGVAGDHILYAEADRLDGPWHARGSHVSGTFDDVFQPTGDHTDFDGTHTCDPSVVRVHGTYYMYYGGYPSTADGDTTRIGVASSEDGLRWARMNDGRPIVVPARCRLEIGGRGMSPLVIAGGVDGSWPT
jgi:hypothetical protein